MRRRTFIAGLGSAAAWSLAVQAQQTAIPIVGYLSVLGQYDRPNLADAFRRGLGEAGYAEGRNVAIEYRFADNHRDHLAALAADLVARKVAVIAVTGGDDPILAAKASTTTIPIVFTFGGDPIRAGFVASLNRPGGNITGATFYASVLTAKVLGLVREMVPDGAVIGLLLNPEDPQARLIQSDAQQTARALSLQLLVLNASTPREIDIALANLRGRVGALLVGPSSAYFAARRQQIVTLAMRDGIPVVSTELEFAAEGALISYGNDVLDLYRRAGLYTGRILKGENPAKLPVDQADKFEFVLNLRSARVLGLTVPPRLLAIADKVIE